jgi:hypothetical protein
MSDQEKKADQLTTLVENSERLGVIRERIRILNAITSSGPTGEFFEMRYDDLLAILNPDGQL